MTETGNVHLRMSRRACLRINCLVTSDTLRSHAVIPTSLYCSQDLPLTLNRKITITSHLSVKSETSRVVLCRRGDGAIVYPKKRVNELAPLPMTLK